MLFAPQICAIASNSFSGEVHPAYLTDFLMLLPQHHTDALFSPDSAMLFKF